MLYLSVIVIILIATVFMVSVGDRLNLPWPVMMTLLGTAALFIPNRPDLTIDSDIILPIFLPPLLWAIGVKFSWGTLRRRWRSVLLYSVLLTTVSACNCQRSHVVGPRHDHRRRPCRRCRRLPARPRRRGSSR